MCVLSIETRGYLSTNLIAFLLGGQLGVARGGAARSVGPIQAKLDFMLVCFYLWSVDPPIRSHSKHLEPDPTRTNRCQQTPPHPARYVSPTFATPYQTNDLTNNLLH